MPEPIQSSLASQSQSAIDGASAEENTGQVCLPSAQPASVSSVPTEALGPRVPTPPAVTSLVARFTLPTGVHPPVVPSLATAVSHCGWEVAGAAVSAGGALVPNGDLVSLLFSGARGVIGIGTANRCVERDEAQQIADGERANQIADCERDGAMPLLKADGSVICATQ